MKRKWYLRPLVVIVMIVIAPPIGYLNVFLNRKKFDPKESLGYLAIATIFAALWMTKFLPDPWRIPALIIVGFYGIHLLKNK
jgi:RsiW-degrading membrane proteinase PrsW (M82 family)